MTDRQEDVEKATGERTGRLERQVKRLTLFCILLLAVPVGLAVLGAAKEAVPDVIEARRFGVVDEAGQLRAVLGSVEVEATRTGEVAKAAESSLVLTDREGKVIYQVT